MQKQDFLLKHIEYFFNALKNLLGMDFKRITMEKFEETCDDFLRRNFEVGLSEIDNLDKEKYQHLLFNENHRTLIVLFFLRIAKLYHAKNPALSKKYFQLSQEILNHSYITFPLIKNEIDEEISKLSQELKK